MGRGCCSTMMQCVLTIINLLTLIVGGAVAAIGILVYLYPTAYLPDLTDYNLSVAPVAIGFIVLGGLLFLIGLFGCCGAMTGNRGMLNIYFVFIFFIIVLEIVVIVYGILFKANILSENLAAFESIFNKTNNGTANEIELAGVVLLQTNLDCCGFDGPDFWTNATIFSGDKVPGSCCDGYDIETSDALCDKDAAWTYSCEEASTTSYNTTFLVILIVLVVLIVLELLCIVMACMVKKRREEKRGGRGWVA